MMACLHKFLRNKTMLRSALLCLPVLLAIPLYAPAADDNRQQPVHLRADRIDIDQKKGRSLYRGDVVFTQGTLRLTAARAEVQSRANELETITAEGKPVTFRHRPEGLAEFIEGEARRAVYHAPTQRVDLYGDVQVKRGSDLLRSAVLHYDIENQNMAAESANGKPVTFRHRPVGMEEFIEGEASRAHYDAQKRQVDLYDNVQLQRGRDLFRSGVLHYDIENQRLIGESAPGRRVYAALVPHSRSDSPRGVHP
jgi:lipopolysaccharide export system protein LptA